MPASLTAPPVAEEPPARRAIPVANSAPTADADDAETADQDEPVEPEIRRAIYAGPPRVRPPDIRPTADVIVELRPPGS